jgi:tripartite-type tricarboxylate transporter receptor subunit TctC
MKALKSVLLGSGLVLIALSALATAALAEYPCKNIRVIVASSAGGGTDSYARAFGALAEKELGTKIVVTNMPGAAGTKGGNAVWQGDHDGCTVLGMSETTMTYGVNGALTTTKDWHYHIFGGSPGVIAVQADSPFKTFQDLLDAAKSKPESVKISNSGIGKLWHLKVVMIEREGDVQFKHVGFNGSKPAMTSLLTGEVDAVSASTGEVGPYIESGKLRALVITETEGYTFPGGEEIPAITSIIPGVENYLPMGQFLAYLFPRDVPQEALDAFRPAFDKVMNSAEFKKFIDSRGAKIYGVYGPEADEMVKGMEQRFSWFAQDMGTAKVNPETLGIARP